MGIESINPDARISQPPWEFERYRRGLIREYPFSGGETLGGAFTLGASATFVPPFLTLNSGSAGANPQSAERAERAGVGTQVGWFDSTLQPYFNRIHHVRCFVMPLASVVQSVGTFGSTDIYLISMGNVTVAATWGPTPTRPVAIFGARKLDATQPASRVWALRTAYGDGIQPFKETVVTGPGNTDVYFDGRMYRLEIWYKPGEYVSAYVDGQLIAQHTNALDIPNPAYSIATPTLPLAGVGVHSAQTAGDAQIGMFANLLCESTAP